MQSLMSGQAAVAVAVSGVQVMSAVASVWGQNNESVASYVSDGEAEEKSAMIFFALSTVFLIVSAGAHGWLVSMPAYKAVAGPLEPHKALRESGDSEERQGLVSRGPSSQSAENGRIMRIAKANFVYEIAVAYVFVVTLVRFLHNNVFILLTPFRLSTLLSPPQYSLPTLIRILSFSVRPISSSSMWGISWEDMSAPSPVS